MTTVKKLASSRRRPNLNPRNGMNIRSNFAVQRNNPAAGDSAKICRAERCMFYANSDFIIRRSTQTRAMKPLKPRAVFSAVPYGVCYLSLRSGLQARERVMRFASKSTAMLEKTPSRR